MSQITLRGFDPEIEHQIKRLAERENISLNKAALKLLRRGAGLEDAAPAPSRIGGALDHLFGSWSAEEAAAFDSAVAVFEAVDEELWS